MFKELLKNGIIFGITFISIFLLKDTFFDKSIARIQDDDFTIIESNYTYDNLNQIKTFFIRNNTSFPINSDNLSITYNSNQRPLKANFTSSNCEYINIKLSKKQKTIFQVNLPQALKNEDFFTISIIYPYNSIISDNLNLNVESKSDDKYLNINSGQRDLKKYIDSNKNSFMLSKSIIVVETFIIFYALLYAIVFIGGYVWNKLKDNQDQEMYNNRNKPKFLKKR